MERVYVSGIGVISALGNSAEANHRALIKGQNGLSSLELFESKYADTFKYGEIKADNESLKQSLKLKDKGIHRTSLLAWHAMQEAIADSALSMDQLGTFQTGLVASNTIGGMSLTDAFYKDANAGMDELGSDYIHNYDFCSVTLFLQKMAGIKGICNTINTACSSAANAIMFGSRLIKNGYCKRVIVGGADSLAKISINGFHALGILSEQACKPFDQYRKGLNLGEGAGFMVLEAGSVIGNKNVYAEIIGYANRNDAFHASSISAMGEGPALAMQGALQQANLQPEDIHFINTHGTATENNDITESMAMKQVFKMVPPFISSKSKIGHTLGAAGAIESVFTMLSLYHQEIYPSLNFVEPILETNLIPNLSYKKMPLHTAMNNSFGFGGNCTSLLYAKV